MTDHWTTPLREPATRPGAKPTSRFVLAGARLTGNLDARLITNLS